ncbi:hypothetical protein CCAX7_004450 [Capsulimonas corticalis]|uniref:Uncharacterized protein n=1 Tax=Capsulimonas corticalis TaxID=2219043 RepID=A0A402D2U7_9BACT|nr:hypothetical protein CCAX7_004450 [Capsulimonas corticalis]
MQAPHQCDLYDYRVTWCRAYPNDISGDQLTIEGGGKPYRIFLDSREIMSVSEWRAPLDNTESPDDIETKGVLVCCGFNAGASREYMIFAQFPGNQWKRVLDVHCAHSNDKHRPEFVDLDGDTIPEVVVTPDYWPIYSDVGMKAGAQKMTSQIWKWSTSRKTYILKTTRPYLQRLRPL